MDIQGFDLTEESKNVLRDGMDALTLKPGNKPETLPLFKLHQWICLLKTDVKFTLKVQLDNQSKKFVIPTWIGILEKVDSNQGFDLVIGNNNTSILKTCSPNEELNIVPSILMNRLSIVTKNSGSITLHGSLLHPSKLDLAFDLAKKGFRMGNFVYFDFLIYVFKKP